MIAFTRMIVYPAFVNSKQIKTLKAIYRDPISGSIDWRDVENLLLAIGCVLVEGNGSRVRFVKDQEVENFHRPHPAKEAKRYQIKAAREFLTRLGVSP